MKYTFGLIGTGNMGSAIARAVSQVRKDCVFANQTPEKAQALAEALGCACGTNETAAEESRYLFLGVKPHLMSSVLASLRPTLKARKEAPVLVSMAAGLSIAQIQAMAGKAYPTIRIMPNTPVAVGQGVVLYECSENVSQEMLDGFLRIMSKAGGLYRISEAIIDAGTAVAGCSPAFFCLMLDAMADGGVACGLPRADALRYAAQTMLGTAQMVLETGKHPAQLKNEVCSPGGSTIQGVRTLEQRGAPAAFMEAIIAAYEKSIALGK